MTAFLRSAHRYLQRAAIRYRYLPRLRELVTYDRKEEMLNTCFEYAAMAGLRGQYLEFGLWKGANIIRAYHLSKRFSELADMRFYGFDSFEGIPPSQSDGEAFVAGSFSGSYEEVTQNLRAAKVDMDKVSLIEGWFADTLNDETRRRLQLASAAVVYVDCDIYESTVPVLDFIEPHLVDGSIVIFDDWYCLKNDDHRGEQKAFTEWLARNPLLKATAYKEFGWDGKAFIMNRRRGEDDAPSTAACVVRESIPT